MNVGIDIDGVLFPWADVANKAVMLKFGVPDPGPHVEWQHLKTKLTNEQWQWLWSAQGQDVVFSQHWQIYSGAVEAFTALLREPRYRCHFVTHRDPRRAAVNTGGYLARHFGAHPWAGLHVIQNACEKHTLMDWDVFIDDKPETVRAMLANTDALVMAPARPWNTGLGTLRHPRFLRYNHPSAVPEVLGLAVTA